jgi:cytochrome P450
MMLRVVIFTGFQDVYSTFASTTISHMMKTQSCRGQFAIEIDAVFEKYKGKVELEHMGELPVLEAAFSESLRLYSIVCKTERLCTKDWRSEKYNLNLRKGDTIIIPIYALNRNLDYYENPDNFRYDRWGG